MKKWLTPSLDRRRHPKVTRGTLGREKVALLGMGEKLLPSKNIANLAQVLEMILSLAIVDKDVVKLDNDKFSDERAKDLIYQPLKYTTGVRETKWNNRHS